VIRVLRNILGTLYFEVVQDANLWIMHIGNNPLHRGKILTAQSSIEVKETDMERMNPVSAAEVCTT
jgi:hypothetical protein